MELRVLKYFLTVAQEENITRAAEVLLTSQSNLSRQLGELEDSLGKKLFIRGSRKITLTEEGMYLRKRAKEIIELTERTEVELMSFDDSPSGIVHIGAAETRLMQTLSKSMMALQKNFPDVTFDIFSGSTLEVNEMVDKGLLDFAVMVAPIDLTKYDYIQLPIKERTGLLMRKDNPLAEKKSIKPTDIKKEPLLVSRQQLDGDVLTGWLGHDVNTLNIVSTFNLITTPSMMVEAGMGSAFTLENLVRTKGDSPLCFRPLSPKVEVTFYLYWKKYQMFSKAAEVFLDQVKQDMFVPEN